MTHYQDLIMSPERHIASSTKWFWYKNKVTKVHKNVMGVVFANTVSS